MPVRRSNSLSSAEICFCKIIGAIKISAAKFDEIKMIIAEMRVLAADMATTESAANDSRAMGDVAANVVAPSKEPSSTVEPSTCIDTLNQGCARTIRAKSCGARAIAKALVLLNYNSHLIGCCDRR